LKSKVKETAKVCKKEQRPDRQEEEGDVLVGRFQVKKSDPSLGAKEKKETFQGIHLGEKVAKDGISPRWGKKWGVQETFGEKTDKRKRLQKRKKEKKGEGRGVEESCTEKKGRGIQKGVQIQEEGRGRNNGQKLVAKKNLGQKKF